MATGQVLRGWTGRWVKRFCRNLGSGGVMSVELWGVLDNLNLAWDLGHKRVWLEIDSAKSLALIEHGCQGDNPSHHLVKAIKEVMAREWMVQWSHAYRGQNKLADWLANFGLGVHVGFPIVHNPLEDYLHLLKTDLELNSSIM